MIEIADVKWIKISTDIFNNRKIKQIRKLPEGDAIIGIWVQILCLAGQINDNGMVYFSKDVPYTEEMLSVEFDRPLNLIRIALQTFARFNMLEIVDNILLVSNWEKYQSTDKLKEMRELNRLRQSKHREKQKLLTDNNVTVTLQSHESNAIDIDIELDKDIDIYKEIVGQADTPSVKIKKFIKPTKEEINQYCKDNNYSVDSDKFIDYYESNGWKVGKNSMKDWKATVRGWHAREKDNKTAKPAASTPSKPPNKFHNFEQTISNYSETDLEEIAERNNKKKLERLGMKDE